MLVRRLLSAALVGLLWSASAPAAEPLEPGVLPPPSSLGESPSESWKLPPRTPNLESILPPQSEFEERPSELPPAATLDAAEILPTPAWYHPKYWFDFDPWDAGIELGINGSEGNNNVFSMRTGGHLRRETPRWKFDSALNYNKNRSNGVETQNNAKLDARVDRTIAESPWTLFVLDNLIYDEFQAWDLQLSLNSGLGYRWIKTPALELLTRAGAGATREFGGAEDDWQPQALLGMDYTHQLTTAQQLVAKADYFPEWEDFRKYRVVTDVGWKIDLDRPKNVSLKVSVIDRYDSTPDGVEPNNLDYAVLLIWAL